MLFVLFYCVAAAGASTLLTRLSFPNAPLRYKLIVGVVLAQVALLIPVHVVATMEIAGIIDRILLPYLALGQAVLLSGSLILYYRRPRVALRARDSAPSVAPHPYLWVTALAVGGAYALGSANVLSSHIREWDAVSYHLLLPLRWLMDRSFAITPETHWKLGMPGNGEATMFVLLAGGLEPLMVLTQWLPLLSLALSVYCLALSLSESRQAAWSCVAVLFTLPIVYHQAFSGYVDLFAAGFLVAAIALGERSLRSREAEGESLAGWLWITGLACGVAVGAKYLYLAYGGLLGITLVGLHAARSRKPMSTAVSTARTLLLGISVPSAFWYLRSTLLTGNPLFPLEVEFGGHVLLPGIPTRVITPADWAIGRWVHSQAEWLVYPWLEFHSNPSMTGYSIDTGLGAAFAAFVPLGIVFFAWIAWRQRSDKRLWWWLAVFVACGLIWWFPLRQVMRFGIVLMALSVVLAAPLFAVLTEVRNRAFYGIFCAAIVVACTPLALESASHIAMRIIHDQWSRAETYRYPTAVDDLPDGSTMLNLVRPNNFAIAGERLSFDVVAYFEAPRPLTSDFLKTRGVDYIVGHGQHEKHVAGLPGVQLFHSSVVRDPVNRTEVDWRIWQVE
jgi:hypothetical protein